MPDVIQPFAPAPLSYTPLVEMPMLAERCGVGRLWAKLENERPLGNFKSLGGVHAALWALARATGHDDVGRFLAARPTGLPTLVCASDGNHGLAVAAGARRAGGPAHIYLHTAVPEKRAARIRAMGATIIRVEGNYDDAVDAAARAADGVNSLVVADTGAQLDDPIVAKVMEGYGRIAAEIRDGWSDDRTDRPTHVFVQTGVGGLAAAMAEGLCDWMDAPRQIITVEPEAAPCVERALQQGAPVRVSGSLETSAEMLSCGLASASAISALLRHRAAALLVDEDLLAKAVGELERAGGPTTTASGAAGLAGLIRASRDADVGAALKLDARSRVLILVTEGV